MLAVPVPSVPAADFGGSVFGRMLQALSEPLMVLGIERRVHFTNAAAEAVLKTDQGLSLQARNLVAEGRDLHARVAGALSATAAAMPGETFPVLLKPRPDGRCAVLHLSLLTPGGGSDAAREQETRIIGKICLNAAEHGPDIHTLRQAFGLSQAEAEIGLLIVAGLSPRRIALKRASSEETVRWHIKNIYSKTYTCRLVDLALQLSTARSPFFAQSAVVHRPSSQTVDA